MPKQESKKRTYGIIGVGALGAFYGAKLQRAGFEVHYLFKSASHRHVCTHGLQVACPKEDIVLPKINAYERVQDMPACDVALITLKTTQNIYLKELLPPLVRKDSMVLIVQNGLGNEEEISKTVPFNTILSGITSIGAYKIGPGKVKVTHEGLLKIAHYQDLPLITEPVKDLVQDFSETGIEVLACEDYLLARFQKLLWNISFNGVSVVYNMTADQIIENHSDLLKGLALELIAIAESYNRQISFSSLGEILLSKPRLVGYKPSMKIDYESNKPMEIEYIYEKLILAAKVKDIVCPHLEKILSQLKELEINLFK